MRKDQRDELAHYLAQAEPEPRRRQFEPLYIGS
jgi:hypothetical protein